MIADFYPIIPAGGAGTRLWPLSRQSSPKFLHDLTGSGQTLLQATFTRLADIAGEDHVMLVTGAPHAAAAASQLTGLDSAMVVAEPSPRDSMAAIGLATAIVARRHGDVVVGSFAADHVIHNTAGFAGAVGEAVAVAQAGYVATIGILATFPATGFGYIHLGDSLDLPGASSARHAVSFTEKPDAITAAEWIASGHYRWNAGMFVMRAQVLLDHLAALHPALHTGLMEIAAAWDAPTRDEVLARVWPTLTRIAIDHAIAEPVAAQGGVAVVPATFDWDDVGDWNSLADLMPARPADGARVLGEAGQVFVSHSADALVAPRSGRPVFVLGVDGAVVVDTPDALLVTTRERAQEVKDVVERLRQAGRLDLL